MTPQINPITGVSQFPMPLRTLDKLPSKQIIAMASIQVNVLRYQHYYEKFNFVIDATGGFLISIQFIPGLIIADTTFATELKWNKFVKIGFDEDSKTRLQFEIRVPITGQEDLEYLATTFEKVFRSVNHFDRKLDLQVSELNLQDLK